MYSGLCPGIHQTGSTEFQVKNHICNRFLKFVLVEGSGKGILSKDSRFNKTK